MQGYLTKEALQKQKANQVFELASELAKKTNKKIEVYVISLENKKENEDGTIDYDYTLKLKLSDEESSEIIEVDGQLSIANDDGPVITRDWENKRVFEKYLLNENEEVHVIDTNQFELSKIEETAYRNFQKDFDLKHLLGLEPISIAKLYIKASAEKKYDVQYALYTDRENYIMWSKENDDKIPESDRGNIETDLLMFKNIAKGTFIKTSDYDGYIEFESIHGSETKSGFHMLKNENGVWQVAFMPIQ